MAGENDGARSFDFRLSKYCAPFGRGGLNMKRDTLIFRVALNGAIKIYRDIEIEASASLYRFAQAIVSAFNFDFDHAFGFYSGLTPAKLMRTHPKYELFADMGGANSDALSVKKTRVTDAFPAIGHTLIFLFDYGDDWLFRVRLQGATAKLPKVRYPRVVASQGQAPEQYPDPDDEADDGPTYGINLMTGEKIYFRK
jgi:pRiA4b ORF-3-like protein